MSDMREYYKFYAIYEDDWITTIAGNTFYRHLVKDYISATCMSTVSSTWVSGGREFIYPYNIKKKFSLEGVVEGEVLFEAGTISQCSDYRVTVFKINADTTKTDLATTGVIEILSGHTYPANDGNSYHFRIDVTEHKDLTEDDRFGMRVEWDVSGHSTTTAKLQHYNGATVPETWIDLPFLLGSE
jgi:hypothetical protein